MGDIPAAEVVLSERVRPALEALAGAGGFRLEAARRSQVVYRPRRSLLAVNDCVLVDGAGAATRRSIVVGVGPKAPTGGAVVEGDGHALQGWVYPHDPALPGLSMWFDAGNRRALLQETGVAGSGSLRARSYRPGRRAVLELGFADRKVFVKAVRPKTVADLQDRHRLLAGSMPVPRSLGWLPEHGVVVMDGLPGESVSMAGVAPSAAAIEALLDRIPVTDHEVVALRDRAAAHGERLRAIVPAMAERVTDLEGRIAAIGPAPRVPVHGDLHAGQLIVDDGALVGVIDVDTAGMGERADDLATLIAHLHVGALGGRREFAALAERLLAAFEARPESADLRARIAAGVFGHAAGPWTRQRPEWEREVEDRLDAAEAWLR